MSASAIPPMCSTACCTTSPTCGSRSTTPTRRLHRHVFALMHLPLGFRFAPRIRDLGETKLARCRRACKPPDDLRPLIGGTLVYQRACPLGRHPARSSIKQGTVTASLMLLSAATAPGTDWPVALRDWANQRTLFIWTGCKVLNCAAALHAGLNKIEARNSRWRGGVLQPRRNQGSNFEQQRYLGQRLNAQ